jgi:hypothetical protein
MLERFLYMPDGRIRTRRMTAVVITLVALALFGSFLITITPAISHSGVQALWVLFAVFLLKLPLVGLLFWLIVRNKEWPMHRPRWSDRETGEILDYISAEADRVAEFPDADRRLAYLVGEAWHVADRAEGERKADAVTVALTLDARRQRRGTHRRSGR